MNATYRRPGLPVAKTPEQWPTGEQRSLAEAGVTTFARKVHAEPVMRPRARPKAKAKS